MISSNYGMLNTDKLMMLKALNGNTLLGINHEKHFTLIIIQLYLCISINTFKFSSFLKTALKIIEDV